MNTEWKPIASAPENEGRPLFCELCWGPEGDQSVGTGFRHNGKWYAAGLFYCLGQEKRYELREVEVQPTHWKPQSDLPDEESAAPTSHPIPTGATGERDWELSCDECNGSGHVFVKHQVAERKTDVQEFKEECEACEGRGFNIAFEDIPGIAEYLKSCRPAPAAGDAQMLEFVREVAQQKPEKPDHWSSCSQCERNTSTAEELLEAHAAIAQQKGEA